MIDTDRYIEVPFLEGGRDLNGWDCYGLCWYVSREAFGIELPIYSDQYQTPLDYSELRALVRREVSGPHWVEPERPRPGDVVVLRCRGLPIHVGLLIDRQWMLHCERSIGTVTERISGLQWKHRILGVHRYVG